MINAADVDVAPHLVIGGFCNEVKVSVTVPVNNEASVLNGFVDAFNR
jgi:hypothetical protein